MHKSEHDMAELQQGQVIRWNDEKGFGFIQPDAGGKQVFFHIRRVRGKRGRPVQGDAVLFSSSIDEQGRLQADQVVYARADKTTQHPLASARGVTALVLLSVVLGLYIFAQLPLAVSGWLALMNILTYISYRQDKRKAQQGEWRTTESTLHLMSLLGGWAGALLAQQILRHKSSKAEFLFTFRLTLLINFALLVVFGLYGVQGGLMMLLVWATDFLLWLHQLNTAA